MNNLIVGNKLKHNDESYDNATLTRIEIENRIEKKDGIYNFFSEINKKYIMIYFIIFMTIYYIINGIDFTYKNIISILIAVFVIYFINDRNDTLFVDDMKELKFKLLSINPEPKYFHHDSGIVELIYSIYDMKKIAPSTFIDLIHNLDTFLEIEELIKSEKPKHLNGLYISLKDFRKKSLNILHSLIHSLKQGDMPHYKKLQKSLKSLQIILNIHVRNMNNFINDKFEEIGTNGYTMEILNDTEEQAINDDEDPHYDIY